jgi:hypothetical protein
MVQRIWNYCYDQTIDLIYIGLLLFKKITLCWGYLLYFEDFQPQIKENIIINILDNNLSFTINPKPDLYNLIEHINKLNKEKLTIFKTSKTTIIYKYHFTYLLNVLHKSNLESIYNVWQFLVNRYKITNKQIITLHKQITRDYFMDLREIIINNSLNKVLELNMGFGIVSYFIINTIKYLSNYHLTIIDENQTKIFNNIGNKLINKYKDNYILIDDNYDNAISNLNKLAIDNVKLFNLIMIDGWSTVEDTLYAIIALDKFISIDGFLCIENPIFKSVDKILNFITTDLRHFKLIKKTDTLVIYKKKRENNISIEYYINSYDYY